MLQCEAFKERVQLVHFVPETLRYIDLQHLPLSFL